MQICRASKITWPDLLTYVVRKLKTISGRTNRKTGRQTDKLGFWLFVKAGCYAVWSLNLEVHHSAVLQLTYDEQYLHCDVTDSCAAGQVVVVANEAHIVGHRDSHVEGGQQNQPIPTSFEGAVVK